VQTGRRASKREAAVWVSERYPEWRGLIAASMSARGSTKLATTPVNQAELAALRAFFQFIRARV
jgi:hypothetical protein